MQCDVSIILCTCNRAKSLRETLAHMRRVLVPGRLTAELIVVDNASTDDTRKVVLAAKRFHIPIRHLREKRPGKSFGLNAGIAAASGTAFLFTDDDVRPRATWVDDMCLPLADGTADIVAGGVSCPRHLRRPWMDDGLSWCFAITPADPIPGQPYLVGANMAIVREVFEVIPGFDPELGPGAIGYGEESLFCRQAQEAGFEIRCDPKTIVEHYFSAERLTRGSLISDATKRGRAAAYSHHHWQHSLPSFPVIRLPLSLARLAWLKLRHPERSASPLHAELHAQYSRVAYWRQILRERRRPRNYARHGLVRLSTDSVPLDATETVPPKEGILHV